ncbi:MAG: hypothetical protein OHK0029_41980 [Armatimonadaceae bacterium]
MSQPRIFVSRHRFSPHSYRTRHLMHHLTQRGVALLVLGSVALGSFAFLSGCAVDGGSAVSAAAMRARQANEEVIVEVRDAPAPAAVPPAPSGSGSAPVLIPRPKQVRFDPKATFTLTANTRILISPEATEAEQRAALLLAQGIQRRCGLRLPVQSVALAGTEREAILFLPLRSSPSIQKLQAAGNLPAPPGKPEGYAISVSPQRVVIAGKDRAGVIWGAQTAIQLLEEGKPQVAGAKIRDYPSLRLRAVHLFHGQNALPFHKNLMGRVLAPLKMNAVFVQAEQVRWNSDPGAAPDWAGTPEQIREEVQYGRQQGITVYPLVQGYGHLQALLERGDRRKYAEDPVTPYAINFTDPVAVAYLTKMIDEADRTFGAPGFHVGLDEIDLRGRMPHRSKGKTVPDLYLKGAKHWHRFFQKRKKPVFIWADEALLAKEVAPDFGTAKSAKDAAKIRAGLPKDAILCTWQYGERSSFPSLKKLRDAGFKNVVAATWWKPRNIQGFSRAAAKVGAMGAIQTTWCGYESSEAVLQTEERKQFTAMVLAAEYFWNGGEGPAPDKLPYDPAEVFTRYYGK